MNNHFKEMTLNEMCQLMEITLPSRMAYASNTVIKHIALITKHIEKGSAYIVCNNDPNVSKVINHAKEKQASAIFIPRKAFQASKLNENDYPVIFTDDWLDQLGKLYSSVRHSYKAKTIAITGTIGKTTTKDLISKIIEDSSFFCNNGNRNSFLTVAKHITEELTDDLDIYVQEIGAGTPLSIEKSAVMLQPDYFLLLNVKNHHLNTYKTFDALFADKTSVDKHMPAHGKIITNFDDEAISEHSFIHPVISFGINTEKPVDYRAINISETNGKLEFDIISEEEVVHITLNIIGRHNVYNALAAYVLARQLAIPTEVIVEKLLKYKTSGIRQNYKNIGGYHLYVDCYNVAFDSIKAGIDTMNRFTLNKNAKRFAIIGGENKLGTDAPSLSYQFGQSLANENVDFFYCYGKDNRSNESLNVYGDAYSICNGINSKVPDKAKFFSNQQELIDCLKRDVKCGDIVFFKGIYLLDMPYIIDTVFGSAYTARSDYYKKDAEIITENSFQFKALPVGNELEIYKSLKKRFSLHIPDTAANRKVYRVTGKAFANSRLLTKVFFGKNIIHIATDAFKNCTALRTLHIPSNVMVIEKSAFENCTRLKEVCIDEGVRHIGVQTFKNCKRLKNIQLPNSIGFIDPSAFEDCPKSLILHCPKHSYAEEFAITNKLNYITI